MKFGEREKKGKTALTSAQTALETGEGWKNKQFWYLEVVRFLVLYIEVESAIFEGCKMDFFPIKTMFTYGLAYHYQTHQHPSKYATSRSWDFASCMNISLSNVAWSEVETAAPMLKVKNVRIAYALRCTDVGKGCLVSENFWFKGHIDYLTRCREGFFGH